MQKALLAHIGAIQCRFYIIDTIDNCLGAPYRPFCTVQGGNRKYILRKLTVQLAKKNLMSWLRQILITIYVVICHFKNFTSSWARKGNF